MDLGNFNKLADAAADELLSVFEGILEKVSVVLVNHQVIGSIHDSAAFRPRLAELMSRHPGVTFIIDSRGYHECYPQAIHKLNDREVMRACGVEVGDLRARVVAHKQVFFPAVWSHTETAVPGTFRIMPKKERAEVLARDYTEMRDMFFREPPPWNEIALEEVEKYGNG